MSVNTKMTAIADEIRTLSGSSDVMGLDAMANHIDEANVEIGNQTNLLEQIIVALDGKVAGGGSSDGNNELWQAVVQRTVTELSADDLAGITKIGDNTFAKCTALISVEIPDGVTQIMGNAFANCTNLTNITIGNDVNNITKYAFNGCSKIASVVFKDPVGWEVTTSPSSGTRISISENDLADPITAATLFKDTYPTSTYYWLKA